MKKLLGLFMVLALAIPASADVLKNVNLIGEIQTIASDVNHNTQVVPGEDYYNKDVNTRVLAGVSAQLVEDVTANVLFQYTTNWNGNASGDSIQDYENNVEVANANVVLSNLFDCLEATVGRQFYGEEDSAVMYFGPNHYNAENFGYAPSVDAAKLTYADDTKALTIIAGKLDLRGAGTFDERPFVPVYNGDFYGADFRMNVTDMMKLQAYIYDFKLDINDAEHSGFYGAKLAFTPEAGLFSVEYARNFSGHRLIKEGEDTGYMVKADAKLDINEFAVRGTFLYEHENFFAFGNYMPGLIIGHRLDGQMDDYSNNEGVRMFNVGFDFNPFEKWTFSLDGYAFQDRFGHHAATWEGDLTAKYMHNEYVQLFAGLGYAKYGHDEEGLSGTGASYKDLFGTNNFKWQLGMLINF